MDISLINYIQSARKKNFTDKQIEDALIQAGWNDEQVRQALTKDSDMPPVPPPPLSPSMNGGRLEKNSHPSMWDAFENALLFISLYVMSSSAALALHSFVDRWMPNIPTTNYYSYNQDFQDTMLKIYMSALLVSFPLFAFLFLDVTKRTKENPRLRMLSSRKRLIYITLVFTFLFMLFNIISIVYNFLNGNVTLNFILHFGITLGVNALIFAYYYNQVKEDRKLYA